MIIIDRETSFIKICGLHVIKVFIKQHWRLMTDKTALILNIALVK